MLRTVAVGLTKICNDLRWMSSGPTTGLAEIHLPDLQPGSSIMPGKVNPVLPEATLMVCAQVVGNDATIAWAGASGSFELNVMMPVMAHALLESVHVLSTSSTVLLAERCVDGITADAERMRALRRVLAVGGHAAQRHIGYEQAAKVAKQALADGATIRETVLAMGYVERGDLTEEQLDAALDVELDDPTRERHERPRRTSASSTPPRTGSRPAGPSGTRPTTACDPADRGAARPSTAPWSGTPASWRWAAAPA